jgi:hypothetical protein
MNGAACPQPTRKASIRPAADLRGRAGRIGA